MLESASPNSFAPTRAASVVRSLPLYQGFDHGQLAVRVRFSIDGFEPSWFNLASWLILVYRACCQIELYLNLQKFGCFDVLY
jgi:hypothetical protein